MLMAYETLILSFISDILIFHYSFGWQNILGALVILAFSVWAIVSKLQNDPKNEQEEKKEANSDALSR